MMKDKMDLTKVSKWCTELTTSRQYPITKEEIIGTWKPVQEDLTIEEQIALLTCLVKTGSVFRWLYLISYFLPDLFSDNQYFVNLMEFVIDKTKNDMAQGVFIRSLIDSGEKYPDIAVKLHSRISASANEEVIHYSGLFLGGAAKKAFRDVFEIIKNALHTGSLPEKVACVKALRVAFENEKRVEFPPEIWDLLEPVSETEESSLRFEVINAYIDFDKFNPEKCEQKLLEFATTGDSQTRFTISNRLWFSNLVNQQKEIELVRICANDSNPRVLINVARILARKGQAFIKDSLEIAKKILANYSEYNTSEIVYSIEELCKNNAEVCLAAFEDWTKTEKGTSFRFLVSEISQKLRMLGESKSV
jgi:hypothetical protein